MNAPLQVPARAHPKVEQLDALTSLRFFAAFFVLLFHCAVLFPAALAGVPVVALGYTGVTFFFVLSGFILAHNYSGADLSAAEGRRRYLSARVARVFPVFLFSLVVGLLPYITEVVRTGDAGLKLLRISGALLAPFGLHAWVPGAACSINCPSWSISAELFFYLLFPMLLAPVMRRPLAWTGGVIAIWIGLALVETLTWRSVAGDQSIVPPHGTLATATTAQFIKHWPLLRLPEFILGIAVYALWKRRGPDTARHALLAMFAGAMAIVAALPFVSDVALHNGLTAVFWVPLIVWAASTDRGWLHSPAAVYLGRISYSLYLLHLPIGLSLTGLGTGALGATVAAMPMLHVGITIAITLIASVIVYERIEEPCRQAVMRRLQTASWPFRFGLPSAARTTA